jgi:hypothetical protein
MGSGSPVISIVIPLYNAGRWIMETLHSIQAQSFENWEVIVVDDGSSDDGPALVEVVAAKDSRLRRVRQANAGPAVARHYGAQQAQGKWLMFLDADDLITPERFARDLGVAQDNPRSSVIAGSVEWFSNDGKVAHQGLLAADPEINRWRHQFHAVFNFSALLMRRDAYLASGGFNPDPAVHYAEDYDFTLRLLESVECTQVNAISLRVRKHETNRSTLAERTVIEHTLEVIRRVWQRCGVDLSLAQSDQLFRFWRQEPSSLTGEELRALVSAQNSLAEAYLKKRPVAENAVRSAWEQTLALRLREAALPSSAESVLLRLEAAERGQLSALRVRLRLLKLRWRR